jgi:hypothetical protein
MKTIKTFGKKTKQDLENPNVSTGSRTESISSLSPTEEPKTSLNISSDSSKRKKREEMVEYEDENINPDEDKN